MFPRPRPESEEPVDTIRYGAAIRTEMPPLASRLMTSYGSGTVAPLFNIRRGKRRELGDAIGEALRDPTDDLSDSAPERSPGPYQQDPLPELVPTPDPEPVDDTDSDDMQPSDETQSLDSGSDDDFHPPESVQGGSPSPSMSRSASPVRPTKRDAPRAPSSKPEPLPAPAPARQPSIGRRPPSQAPASTVPPPSQDANRPPSRGGRFKSAKAALASDDRRSAVSDLAAPQLPTGIPRDLLSRPESTSNSTRSFGAESDIFRNANIDSPSPVQRPPDRPAAVSPEKPSAVGSLRQRLTQARGGQLGSAAAPAPAPAPKGRFFDPSLAPRPRRAGLQDTAGPQPALLSSVPEKGPPPSKGRRPAKGRASSARAPQAQGSPAPTKKSATDVPDGRETGSASQSSGLSGLRPGRFWRAVKPKLSLWEYLRPVSVLLLVSLMVWGLPSLLSSAGVSEWTPSNSWDGLSYKFDQLNPFASAYSNASVDAARMEYKKLVRQSIKEIENLQKSSKMYEGSVKKLEALMPRVVHMEVKNGKPRIPDDFWHALRDLIMKDREIVSVKGTKTGPVLSSSDHWDAVAGHVESDLAGGKRLSKAWEAWLKKNRNKVNAALGIDERSPAAVVGGRLDPGLKDAIGVLMKEKLKGPDMKDTVVTRQDFVQHLRAEFATHRQEIRSETKELEKRLEAHVKQALLDAAAPASSPSSGGQQQLSARDVKRMVHEAVQDEVRRAQLGALARGGIRASWDSDLQHRVNFFAHGTGAIVNPHKSSPTFGGAATDAAFGSRAWIKARTRAPPMPYNSVLLPWDDSGDGWCGSASVSRDGRANGVTLSIELGRSVTPEHVVVEHILPDGTLYPGARPRDVEVWAHVEGVELQRRLGDFAASHFPPAPPPVNGKRDGGGDAGAGSQPPTENPVCDGSECFYLIGRFEYESVPSHGGVFVHRLSDELRLMGVKTDHVRIVARTNYGDEEKTCFYRVRLYGEAAEEV